MHPKETGLATSSAMRRAMMISAAVLLLLLPAERIATADDDPEPTDEPEVWTLLPQSEWMDEFSPLYTDGEDGFCEGDPSLPDEPPGGPPPLVDLRWEIPNCPEIMTDKYLANRATIRFQPATTSNVIRDTMTELGLEIINAWFDPAANPPMSWFYVEIIPSSSFRDNVPGLLLDLRGRATVQTADYDVAASIQDVPTGTPNDPDFPKQVELTNLHANTSWPTQANIAATNVIGVVVFDSGIWTQQPDLKKKIYKKPGTNKRWGMKYNNKKIKAKSIEKQKYMREPQHVYPGSSHGSAVASVIAADGNNSSGICGFAPGPQVTVMAAEIPMIGAGQFDSAAQVPLLKMLTKKFTTANFPNLRVVNMSLGSHTNDQGVHDAINADRTASGRYYIAAAGNYFNWMSSVKSLPYYPASWPEVLGVTGVDPNGASDFDVYNHYSAYSDVYSSGTTLDLSVLGVSAYMTCRVTAWNIPDGQTFVQVSGSEQGTSVAAPQISALAALLFAKNPQRTASWVDGHIKRVKKHGDYHQIGFYDNFATFYPTSNRQLPGVADFALALSDDNP